MQASAATGWAHRRRRRFERGEARSDRSTFFEWAHLHFPNLMDCRPIYVRRALEASGFTIKEADVESMWVPVEIVLAEKP